MGEIYELKSSSHIRTGFKDFYKIVKEKGFIENQYQLFTYAFLVGLSEEEKYEGRKSGDICSVHNIQDDLLTIIKGIALMKLDCENGEELLNEIMDYADGGIQILMKDYENDHTIRLDKYIE